MGLVAFDDDEFAECTLNMRKGHGTAVKPHGQAMIVLGLLAKTALAAGARGGDGNALARVQAGHLRAHTVHDARDLMAQRHWLANAHRAKAPVLKVMQVRAADATKGHSHQQLVRAGRGNFGVLDTQILGAVTDDGFHGLHQRVAVMPPSTYRIWPLTKREASLARNTIAGPRSSTSPQRRLGVCPTSQAEKVGSSTRLCVSSVLK